jgi:hypothetical protein
VSADGTVVFSPGSIEDVTRELLQYFGPHFVPPDKTDVGSSWTVNFNRAGTQVQTEFTIDKVDGNLIIVHELQKGKFSTYTATAITDGRIVIKPSMLVPISGDIKKTLSWSDAAGDVKQELQLHFERVADTRDGPAK